MPPTFDVGVISANKSCNILKITIPNKRADIFSKKRPDYNNDFLLYHLRSKVNQKGKYPYWSFVGPIINKNGMEDLDQSFIICYYSHGNVKHEHMYSIDLPFEMNKKVELECYDDMIVLSLQINCKEFKVIDYTDVIQINATELKNFQTELQNGNLVLYITSEEDLETKNCLVKKKKELASATIFATNTSSIVSKQSIENKISKKTSTVSFNNDDYIGNNSSYFNNNFKLLMYKGKLNDFMHIVPLQEEEYVYSNNIYKNKEENLSKTIPTLLDAINNNLLPNIDKTNIWLENRYSFQCTVLPLH